MPVAPSTSPTRQGQRLALLGLVANVVLAAMKLVAGLIGNSYALVADAIESIGDIAGSVIIWGGLHISAKPADEDHPYGHGKAEALAGFAVAIMAMMTMVIQRLSTGVRAVFAAILAFAMTAHSSIPPLAFGMLLLGVAALARRR